MLRFGLPLIPGLIGLWATAYADRLLLANIEDLDAVGLYAIAARFAAPVTLLLTAFVTAYHPFLSALRMEDDAAERDLRGRVATLVAVALLGPGVAIAIFGPQLIYIVTPGFDDAAEAIAPLVLGAAAYGVSSVFLAPILISRRTDVSALSRAGHGRGQRRALPAPHPGLRHPRRGPRVLRRLRAAGRARTGGGAAGWTTRRTSPCGC